MGGSGSTTFRLLESPSGGLIDPIGGAYLAGPTPGVTDLVAVTDPLCGEAILAVDVVPPLAVTPLAATLTAGASFPLAWTGGSGAVDCALSLAPSGGSLADCAYTAGAAAGTDVVEVRDPRTGRVVEARFEVEPGLELGVYGGRLALPLGWPYVPTLRGGTGRGVLSFSGIGAVELRDGALVGTAPGRVDVVIDDPEIGLVGSFRIDVLSPLALDIPLDGERSNTVRTVAADLDADGYQDLVLGIPKASVEATKSGGVYVYAGGPLGLSPAPVRVISRPDAEVLLGMGVAVGDVDGDGLLDLAYGGSGVPPGGLGQTGWIRIHRGIPGGFFSEAHDWELTGDTPFDHRGWSLAACDVDGDGTDDLLAAAFGAEDEGVIPAVFDQGALFGWPGGPAGPAPDPAWRAWGKMPSGAGFAHTSDLYMGYGGIAAGDWDGDGRCDPYVAAFDFTGQGGDGAVWVFDGGDLSTGIPADPIRIFQSANLVDFSPGFGRSVSAADLDGDGRKELFVSSWLEDVGGLVNAGSLQMFDPADDDGRPAWTVVTTDDATWGVTGTGGFDQLGLGHSVGDHDGDGALDVYVGAPNAELADGVTLGGRVYVFDHATVAAGGVSTPASAAHSWISGVQDAFFGLDVRAGDFDADGDIEAFVWADRDSTLGLELGAPYVVDPDLDGPALLELPSEPAGAGLGVLDTVLVMDANFDGQPDVFAGAAGIGVELVGANAGGLYQWSFDGAAWGDAVERADHPDHGALDFLGESVASAGDFDGDGYEDVVATSWLDGFNPVVVAGLVDPDGCHAASTGQQTGSAWVYRGGPDGIDLSPSFRLWGYDNFGKVDHAVGGFDHDGDGRSEIAVSGRTMGLFGGVRVFSGRDADPAGILVVCDAVDTLGTAGFAGDMLEPLGDLDGDGCDELLVGVAAEPYGAAFQGTAHILWGTCTAPPALTTLALTLTGSTFWLVADWGLDADGNGRPDMLIGAPSVTLGAGALGAVWLLDADWLAALPRQPVVDGELPAIDTAPYVLLPDDRRLLGADYDTGFGSSVALVPAPDGGLPWVMVGAPSLSDGGEADAGGALAYRWTADTGLGNPGFEGPILLVAGEAAGSGMGTSLSPSHDQPYLAVGADLSDALGLDVGAVYVLDLR